MPPNLPTHDPTFALSELRPGARAKVSGFRAESAYSAQLMRLGLIPGTEITVIRVAPLGDPIEIRFRGFALALRPSEAHELILAAL
jgi:ferrous iron transport protein A